MTVNKIPHHVVNTMQKTFKDFLWNGRKKGYLRWTDVIAPRAIGGLNMPDVQTQMQAIQIMWIKKWLAPPETRPPWGFVMDAIIAKNIPDKPVIDSTAVIDWALQMWNERDIGEKCTFPDHVRLLLRTVRKFNAGFAARKIELALGQ